MAEVQISVTQEDYDNLMERNPQFREMLKVYALERVVAEQAAEISRLNEQISGMEGEDDA